MTKEKQAHPRGMAGRELAVSWKMRQRNMKVKRRRMVMFYFE